VSEQQSEIVYAPPPSPASERGAWALAITICVLGLAVVLAVLTGVVGSSTAAAPPAILFTPTPAPGSADTAALVAAGARRDAVSLSRPVAGRRSVAGQRFVSAEEAHIASVWMSGFYPIYATAQRTFAVNWLLLASIHMQESAFSTSPGIYQGLNFAHCCGGPMQFNVTNGPLTTWDLVSDSYRDGPRPAAYNHMTAKHPSIYDDFDSIMAAAHLLSADGAGYPLDGTAWVAAYDYYGHDATGVSYADEVIARAISWSQHGFCISCTPVEPLVRAVHAAYGAPVLAALQAPARRGPAAKAAGRVR
jgi:hypothetical protein